MEKVITNILDGKSLRYTSNTLFEVQVGKGKSSYKTKYSFRGNLHQAVMYYRMINIHSHHKKRLIMDKKTIARTISS